MSATDLPVDHQTPITGQASARIAATRNAAHLGGVDWLRLIGIAAIAYYHAATVWYPNARGAAYAFAGLHALTAAAAYFAAASRSAKSDGEILIKRFHRVLVPWFAFSAIHIAMAVRSHHFQTSMLWVGGSTHLWFLPFIFVVGCAIGMLSRRGLIVRSLPSAIGWTLAAAFALAIDVRFGSHLPAVEPLWQIVNALPSALMGVALFAAPTAIAQVVVIGGITGAAAAALGFAGPSRAWPAAASVGALAFHIARLLPIRATTASCFAGRASFGVYLMHMLALAVVVRGIGKITHSSGEAVASDPFGLIIVAQVVTTVVICLVAVAVLERTPFRRFIG